jgi:hypothetical protein
MAHGMGQRLREGRATLQDQVIVRLTGLAAYGCFAAFMWKLCDLQNIRPDLAAQPAMLLACLLAVIVFHTGSALALIGPELFRAGGQVSRTSWLDQSQR